MTDLILVEDIAAALEGHLKSHGIQALYGKDFADFDVYRHDLPLVEDEDAPEQKNYILIMVGEQESDREEWDTQIHFSVNVEDRDRNRSGNMNVLYLMDEIYLFFTRMGIIGKHSKMEPQAYKVLNMEAGYPFYEGDLVTHWKLPLPNEEGLEDFI